MKNVCVPFVGPALVALALLPQSVEAQTVSVDAALLEQLQQIIEQQQQQLTRQSELLGAQTETIDTLEDRLDQLEQRSIETQTIAAEAQSTAEDAADTAQRARAGDVPDTVVTSGEDRIKLAISGHINRAVNLVEDGNKTEAFFVDNDTSTSRLRFVGTADVTDETTLGSVIEIAFSPNNSFDVSQDSEESDDFTDLRRVEAWARNDAYGQLLFGKGSAAADDAAEYDLSLVAGPIMYSGVADIVGGIQFTDGTNLTGTTVADAFFNFDGERQDRVRYDSPIIGPGLQISASAGADEQYDAAITWGGDYGDWTGVDVGSFTTLGALSFREPNETDVDWRLAGSMSALHNPTGLSATVSGGMEEADTGDNPYNLYGKLAWDTSIFSFGPTGFGVDYTYGENISADGDEGTSFGIAGIQLFEDYSTELYAQFRYFELDENTGPSPDDIIVGTVGARVKF